MIIFPSNTREIKFESIFVIVMSILKYMYSLMSHVDFKKFPMPFLNSHAVF